MTLFDKLWAAHTIQQFPDGPTQLYIDRHLIHEVTSPQAFESLEQRGLPVLRPAQTFAVCDHNVPTMGQELPIRDPESAVPVALLAKNTAKHGIRYFPLGDMGNGVVHVVGPEQGITLPGITIVCGDSHTATHGAFGSIAFGIGTSEVEMVFAGQSLLQVKPKQMRITVDGRQASGVNAKDVILYLISQIGNAGGAGYFIEYAGSVFQSMSMDERMTVCNMSIEMGARGGLMAPDQTTFDYVQGRPFAPSGTAWESALRYWQTLYTDTDAAFDKEFHFQASDIPTMITYGTNPGMGMPLDGRIPSCLWTNGANTSSYLKALHYMNFKEGQQLLGHSVDYIFVGSCTNGRYEDFVQFAKYVQGRQKSPEITAWLVPGSRQVAARLETEGWAQVLRAAGFELRQPGCSACLAMNDDKIPSGKYALSTSNRNFEGRQGPGARTLLCSPLVAAAAALSGCITVPEITPASE